MPWTEEQKDSAIRLWREGRSAAFIAAELETITRNAVVGLMHRMGIRSPKLNPHSPVWEHSGRRNYVRAAHRSERARQAPGLRAVVAEPPPIQCKPVTLLDAGVGDCRWPLTDSDNIEEFRFCGAAIWPTSSYCPGHHLLVHRPQDQRRPARHWRMTWSSGAARDDQTTPAASSVGETEKSPPLYAELDDIENDLMNVGQALR
jgi:GcrA cell cycle regulator